MLKTNVESLVRMKLRAEVIHPELWVEREYVTTCDSARVAHYLGLRTDKEW